MARSFSVIRHLSFSLVWLAALVGLNANDMAVALRFDQGLSIGFCQDIPKLTFVVPEQFCGKWM